MQAIIVVLITVSVATVISGFIYFLLCKKTVPLQKEDFAFDDIYLEQP